MYIYTLQSIWYLRFDINNLGNGRILEEMWKLNGHYFIRKKLVATKIIFFITMEVRIQFVYKLQRINRIYMDVSETILI